MKANELCNELSIKDWVLYSNRFCQVIALDPWLTGIRLRYLKSPKVDEFGNKDYIVYKDVRKEDISPIPLTADILEKNGFYWGNTATEEDFCSAVGCGYPDSGWCFDEGAGEIKILFPNETDGGLVLLDDQSGDRHLELVFGKPLMVHQLQHALRLCGIEKDIVL